jgi:hypothetical protein
MERYKIDEMRDFLRLHLGDDWEMLLILGNAIAGPFASNEEIAAAQQRAIDLVREHSPGWTDDMTGLVAAAWLTLWMAP